MRAWPGGLAIARSIGDVDCGDFVSPQPDVRTVPAPASGFVILGSDGVWDALSLTCGPEIPQHVLIVPATLMIKQRHDSKP